MTPDVFNELCVAAGIQPASIEQLKRELEDEGLLLHHEERVYLRSPMVAKAVAEAIDETSKAAPVDVRIALARPRCLGGRALRRFSRGSGSSSNV